MNITVTGASGFLGYHLIKKLINEGHQVQALASDAADVPWLKPFNITKHNVDIRDMETHKKLFQGQDVVYHLAAKLALNNDCRDALFSINVEGTKAVAQAALETGVKRFIHASSIHALSRAPLHECIDESRPLALDEHFDYDRSKAHAELALAEYREKGLNTVVANLTGLWGPEDFSPSKMGACLFDFMKNKKHMVACQGGFNFMDVRDAANTLTQMIHKGTVGERYILAGEWHHSREIAQTATIAAGNSARLFLLPIIVAKITLPLNRLIWKICGKEEMYTEQSLVHIRSHRFISDRKARHELGHQSRPLIETMRDIAAWLKASEI